MDEPLRQHPNFARWLRWTRRNADRTQQQLANALHVRKGAVANWENGYAKPSLAHFRQLLIELPLLGTLLAAPVGVIQGRPAIGSKYDDVEKPEPAA